MMRALGHLLILALAIGSYPLVSHLVESTFPQLFEPDCGGDLIMVGSYVSVGICLSIYALMNVLYFLGYRALSKIYG